MFILLIVLSGLVLVFGISFTTVTTYSMEPSFNGFVRSNSTIDIFNGDFVILQKKTPQIGDVILFRPVNENGLYFHRVIAKTVLHNQTYYLTKGDNNRYTDNSQIGDTQYGWIPQSNVVGVAILTVHWIGWWVDTILSIDFLIPFLGIIILLGIFYYTSKDMIIKKLRTIKFKPNRVDAIKFKKVTIPIKKFHSKTVIVIILLAVLSLSSIAIELSNAQNNKIEINLLQTDGTPLPGYINLANPHLFDLEDLVYGTQSVYMLDIKIQITSGGIFDSLNSVTLRVLSPQSNLNKDNYQLYYRWISISHFAGTRTINGVLIIPYNILGQYNTTAKIQINYTVSHLYLFQNNYSKNQSISFS